MTLSERTIDRSPFTPGVLPGGQGSWCVAKSRAEVKRLPAAIRNNSANGTVTAVSPKRDAASKRKPPKAKPTNRPNWLTRVRREKYRAQSCRGTSGPTQAFQAGPAANPVPK